MDPITRQAIAVAAGGAAADDAIYVDDVFSTFLYEGSQPNAQTINNGLDLSGEGGLVWLKQRSSPNTSHFLFDTERGTSSTFGPDSSGAAYTSSRVSSFNSNGFSLTNDGYSNGNGHDYVSWSFRKAPGFFDVVTYTGNGTAGRTVSHSLGSVPGMIIVKKTSGGLSNWCVYHRNAGNSKALYLNTNVGAFTAAFWNNTSPTSTEFTLNNDAWVNGSGDSYVAYVFAHDDQSFGTNSDEAIVKCGSLNISSQGTVEVNLGWEAQFVMLKPSSFTGNWFMFDTMRGMAVDSFEWIYANRTDAAESKTYQGVYPTPTGFGFNPANNGQLGNGTYIYMAIRRPHKPPTAGTEVFELESRTSTTPNLFTTSLSYVDVAWNKVTSANGSWLVTGRLLGNFWLAFNATHAKQTPNPAIEYDYNNKIMPYWWSAGQSEINYLFKRAPGFFDVVAYTGNGSATRQISHNLGATPELIIVKSRSNTSQWLVWSTTFGQGTIGNYMTLNSNGARSNTNPPIFTTSAPTSTYFNVAYDSGFNVQYVPNVSSYTYIAYLFATLDGVSKVGTYSGTGYDVNVDCGFTAGARFVLIKRTDSSGDWHVYDTASGIVSGEDPHLYANTQANHRTGINGGDYIDPLNAGFTVTSSAPAALNASGGTYLFLAIA